jgi:hypothetical protein
VHVQVRAPRHDVRAGKARSDRPPPPCAKWQRRGGSDAVLVGFSLYRFVRPAPVPQAYGQQQAYDQSQASGGPQQAYGPQQSYGPQQAYGAQQGASPQRDASPPQEQSYGPRVPGLPAQSGGSRPVPGPPGQSDEPVAAHSGPPASSGASQARR